MQLQLSSIPTFANVAVSPGMAGGLGGEWTARLLEQYFAPVGSHILLGAGLLVAMVLVAPSSLIGIGRRVPQLWIAGKTTAKALIPDRQAIGEKVKTIKPNKPVKIHRSRALRGGIGSFFKSAKEEKVRDDSSRQESLESDGIVETDESLPTSHQEDPAMPVKVPISKSYQLPSPIELLSTPAGKANHQSDHILESQSQILTQTLKSFSIEGRVTEIHPGPVITMYEFAPGPGIKVARIVSLADDLAMALKALTVRVVAPLPNKSTVGIEVPNPNRDTVTLRDMLTSDAFLRSRSKLSLALGKDIYGTPVVADLRTMPHLLVAGATGAGKSVGLNCMLLNILFQAHPDEVKLLLIDPKVLELQTYDGVPHLLRPVITDPKAAAKGLTWVVQEMERRYRLLAEHDVRSIDAFNRKIMEHPGYSGRDRSSMASRQPSLPLNFATEATDMAEKASHEEKSSLSETPVGPLPYIVVVIDEFADLMMVAPKDVEDRIARLAQMARASGIHLILATQRPSVDVVTGLIKANFPARIAYQVSSKIDSRTILDTNGAEALLGRGDMLYMASGTGRINRLHGPFVSDDEVRHVVEWVKQQAGPAFQESNAPLYQDMIQEDCERDDVYERARDVVIGSGQASASLIQRRIRVGYPRAARMIEQMEEEGLVSSPGRDGRREVLVRREAVEERVV